MIDLEHVTKRYGGHTAIDDLSLSVPTGSTFGLLGPNGAGKTTLLRLVMGVLRPDAGDIRVFDGLRPGSRAATRRIGYMPQALALYEGLTVAENVAFFGRMYGLGGAELTARVEDVLHRVELGHRRDSLARTLSGGMMRRAMLASAMVHQPRLLILDEPTAGVDPLLRLRFWDWFRQLAADGTTVLVTTHHISEAAQCGQVLFLRTGRLLEQGPPGELIAHYGAHDLEDAFVRATRAKVSDELPDGSDRPGSDPPGSDPPDGAHGAGGAP